MLYEFWYWAVFQGEPMREAVKKAFYDYTLSHEGYTPFMYADIKNLITTGVGNLIDGSPNVKFGEKSQVVNDAVMAKALALPWKHKGPDWTAKKPTVGAPATQEEIKAAWIKTKTDPMQGNKGGFAYQNLTDLTLSMDDIQTLFDQTRDQMEVSIRRLFPRYEEWPADAQVAIMSMAWAMGPDNLAQFKTMVKALNQDPPDFVTASKQCQIQNFGSLTDPKSYNGRNSIMFMNAADAQAHAKDYNVLFFGSGSAPIGGSGPTPSIQDKLASGYGKGGSTSVPAGSAPNPTNPSEGTSIMGAVVMTGAAVGIAYAGFKYGLPLLQKKLGEP